MMLTAPYFFHSSHCEVSNTWCLPVQHIRIPLQVKWCLQHLTPRAKFTKSLNKSCHSLSFGSIKLMCFKSLGCRRHNLSGPYTTRAFLRHAVFTWVNVQIFVKYNIWTPLGLLDPEMEALRYSEASVTIYCQHGGTSQKTWISSTPLGEPLTSQSENRWEDFRTGQLYQRLSSNFHFGSNRTKLRDNFLLVIQE